MSSRNSFAVTFGLPGISHAHLFHRNFLDQQIRRAKNNLPRSSSNSQVVLKTAPQTRLIREGEILKNVADCLRIRQWLDQGVDPPFLVLEYMDNDALRLSGEGILSRSDIKAIARGTLQALSFLHAQGMAHTGKVLLIDPPRGSLAEQMWTKTSNQITSSST